MASIRSKTVVLFSIAAICVSLIFHLSFHLLPSDTRFDPVLRLPSEISDRRLEADGDDSVRTRRPIQVAGSSIYGDCGYLDDDSLMITSSVSQLDADVVYYWLMFRNSPEGSSENLDAQKNLLRILTDRVQVDEKMNLIGKLLFGSEKGIKVLSAVRPAGQPLVDDWACHKSMIQIFVTHCGSLSHYGLRHSHSFDNIFNAGINKETMAKVSAEVCSLFPFTPTSSLHSSFTA